MYNINLGQYGVLAQLGEHLPYKQEVRGSSPLHSTIIYKLERKKKIMAKFTTSSLELLKKIKETSENKNEETNKHNEVPFNSVNFNQFKCYIGEIIGDFQLIEHDLKEICTIAKEKLTVDQIKLIANKITNKKCNDFDVSKLTLGQIIHCLKYAQKFIPELTLSEQEYKDLFNINKERQYLVHKIFIDFCYIHEFINSKELNAANNRVDNTSKWARNLQKKIEQKRIELNNIFNK